MEFLEELFSSATCPALPLPWEQQRDQQQQQQEDGDDEDEEEEEEARLARAQAQIAFLDLGTGNGDMLFGLRDAGWTGPMLGVDYSERSVEFARRIGAERLRRQQQQQEQEEKEVTTTSISTEGKEDKEEEENVILTPPPPVEFAIHDLLSDDNDTPSSPPLVARPAGWDVVLDKGTFDAISLSAGVDARTGRRVAESYRDRVLPLVRPGGLFLVTSCNWTEDELACWFVPLRDNDNDAAAANGQAARFEQVGRVEYPSFSFGGVKGSTISTLCFRKVTNGSA